MKRIIREAIRNVLSEARENFEQKANQLKKRGITIELDTFNEVNYADPTSVNDMAGKYFDWLLRVYVQQDDWDVDMLRTCLTFFERKRNLISSQGQSVQIADYDAKTLINLVETLSGTSLEWENAINRFGNAVQVVYKDERYIVVHCNTWEAERYFGRSTKWCTVANNDMFTRYNSQGLLFIAIPIENGRPNIDSPYKMQCDFSNGDFHCANAKDRTFRSFEEYYQSSVRRWQYDKPMIMALNKINNNFHVPVSYEEGGERNVSAVDEIAQEIQEWWPEKVAEDVILELTTTYEHCFRCYEDEDSSHIFLVFKNEEDLHEAAVDEMISLLEDECFGEDEKVKMVDYIDSYTLDSMADDYASCQCEDHEEDFCRNEDGETEDEMRERLVQDGVSDEEIDEALENTEFIYNEDGMNETEFAKNEKDYYRDEYIYEDIKYWDWSAIFDTIDIREYAEDKLSYYDDADQIGDYHTELSNGMIVCVR